MTGDGVLDRGGGGLWTGGVVLDRGGRTVDRRCGFR
jgi:hypothetical protein